MRKAVLGVKSWVGALRVSTMSVGSGAVTRDPAAFRMPAEWEPHSQTFMGWPHRPENWRRLVEGDVPAQLTYSEVAKTISKFEPVTVLADAHQVSKARRMLGDRVSVLEMALDDAWLRDTGPTFVVSREADNGKPELVGVDWDFNTWGWEGEGGEPPWENDKQVASKVLQLVGARRIEAGMVLEGGSIHVDGEGTLLTTEECLLNQNRNPMMSKQQIEDKLKGLLGVRKVIWLPKGAAHDDDTSGHIDNMACFAAPGVVLLHWTDDTQDAQYDRSHAALQVLERERDAQGRRIQVVKVPMPGPLFYTEAEIATQQAAIKASGSAMARKAGTRMPATYINFYICNGGIVMPGFGVETDEAAKRVLQAAFPDRQVLQVKSAREILLGGGNIHCITQQQPVAG